jgi:glycosyltransferase involved in cell wall biosynthesis
MGWNFVKGLSETNEVHVITEQEKWVSEINAYLAENPELKKNLHFYFIHKKRNRKLRKIWPPSYYWFYKVWQKKAYKLALQLDEIENFDIVHQLNMVGYREPGYLWKINKPFVWGPIGGLENSPWSFLPSLGVKGFIFYCGRNLLNLWQRNFYLRPKFAAKRLNSSLIAATPNTHYLIKKLWKVDSTIINEVGQHTVKEIQRSARKENEPIKIIWSGFHTPGKNLSLLLYALNKIETPFELHVLGKGEMTNEWKSLANSLGLMKNITWHGWLKQDEALNVMSKGHVLAITSISDLTSTVTLEALSYGLPIICLDHCGFADVVNNECGIKIAPTTPKKASKEIADAIEKLYKNESYRMSLSEGAVIRASDFSWPKKIAKINEIYTLLISSKND